MGEAMHGRALSRTEKITLKLIIMERNSLLIKGILFFLSLLPISAYAQSGTDNSAGKSVVTGFVSDALGEPLVGVSVIVENHSIGVPTDENGAYKITLPKQNVNLVFSCIGFETQVIPVGRRSVIDVIMEEDANLIEETVVVGYGVQKKESSVAAIASVKGDDLSRTNHANIANALSGQVSGMSVVQQSGMPGQEATKIIIRGVSSWSGSNPLVLVDGVERDFTQIDPNEIESMSVLKDASATAVFGVRGANGVILITTKRGKAGDVKVNFTAEGGMKEPINMLQPMDSYNTALVINQARMNDGTWGSLITDDIIEHYRVNDMPYVYTNTNWQDFMLKTGWQQKYNMNVSGGNDFARVFASLGYLHDGDVIRTDKHEEYDPAWKYDRFNYRFNLDLNLTKTTVLSVDAGGYLGIKNAPYETNTQRLFRPIFALGPMDGVPFYPASVLEEYPDATRPDESGWRLGSTDITNSENPYVANSFSGSRTNKTSNINLSLILKQDLKFITPGLSAKFQVSYNNVSNWLKTISYNAPSYKLLQNGTWIRRLGRSEQDREEPEHIVSAAVESLVDGRPLRTWYMEGSLLYDRAFGKHDVTGMVVFQRRKRQSQVAFPSYQQGLAARVTYTYDKRYLFEANVGYNGSEQFSPEKQYGVFPSFALGYNLHNEKFFKPLKKVISKAKVRASWGQVGSDSASERWLFTSAYVNGSGDQYTSGISGVAAGPNRTPIVEEKAANENATWEIATKRDIGFELSFLKNKMFTLVVDFFDERRDGILLTRAAVPTYAGIQSKQQNLGKTHTKGYEVELKFQWSSADGDWYVFAKPMMGFSDNRIISKDEPMYAPAYKKAQGYRIGQIFAYHHTGYIQDADAYMTSPAYGGKNYGLGSTEYVDFNGDGIIDDNDMFAYGYSQTYPLYNYALSLGFSWKNFDFDMMFQAATHLTRQTVDIFSWSLHRLSNQVFEYQLDTWTPYNRDARYPAIHTENYRQHDNVGADGVARTVHLYDASYIRLKNVNVSYRLPQRAVKKMGLNSMKFYVRANNLFTFAPNYPLADPEASDSGGNITNAYYPMTRTISLGVQLGF